MKTFWQFLTEVQHQQYEPINQEGEFHLNDLSYEELVQFTLYCAEDVFNFNNNTTRDVVKSTLSLVTKWLEDHKEVTDQELQMAYNDIVTVADSNGLGGSQSATFAARAAANAVMTAAYASDALDNANYAALNAVTAYAYGSAARDGYRSMAIRRRKRAQYMNYINLIHKSKSSVDTHPNDPYTTGDNNLKSMAYAALVNCDTQSLAVFFDAREEQGDNLVSGHGNQWKLNLPPNVEEIVGRNPFELAQQAVNDKAVMAWLRKLYAKLLM